MRKDMYLRPDEWRVLEKKGFAMDEVTKRMSSPWRELCHVNREARMGRTALIIHPTLKDRSLSFAEPASILKPAITTSNFRSI